MPTVGGTITQLADVYKSQGEEGAATAEIIEVLHQKNEIWQEAELIECNDGSTHKTTIRTGLPENVFRKLNQGIPKSKSTSHEVRDVCGMIEGLSQIDVDEVKRAGDGDAQMEYRFQESVAHLEAMSQTAAETFVYGDTDVEPEKFLGVAPRYSSHGTDDSKSSFNVINAGGVGGDNTSIWRCNWGPLTTHFLYPKGSMAGVHHYDKGEQMVQDVNGDDYFAFVDHYKHDLGLTVRDWRGTGRVANIDVSEMRAGNVAIEDYMIDLWYRCDEAPAGRPAWYCNRDVQLALHQRAKDKVNVNLTLETFEGRQVVMLMGEPIRRLRRILNTEQVVPEAA